MKKNNLVITLKDYERIFQVIHSVHQDINQESKYPSCMFYNVAGCLILNRFYNKEAAPMMGFAIFNLDNIAEIGLCFGHRDNDYLSSSPKGFHCWIEVDGYFLDFTAPLYDKYLERAGLHHPLPKKMFQKKLDSMTKELNRNGDFYTVPNIELTQEQLDKIQEETLTSDGFDICLKWFKKPPKKIGNKMLTINELGIPMPINLIDIKLSGAW